MNDDSLTPEAELASAALDNEVTRAERAKVDASQSLAEELAVYTDLRHQLSEVSVPADVRESALAAALAVFDELQMPELQTSDSEPDSEPDAEVATWQSAAVAPVISLGERRQRQYRWIGSAAAAAVVAVVAISALANLGDGSDEKSTSVASSPSAETVSQAAATQPPALASAQADQSTEAAAEDAPAVAASPETTSGGLSAINSPADVSPWFDAQQIETDEALIAFVTSDAFAKLNSTPDNEGASQTSDASGTITAAAGTSAAGTAVDSAVEAACPSLSVGPSAAVIYKGEEVFVVHDLANREILVVNPANCTVITVSLP